MYVFNGTSKYCTVNYTKGTNFNDKWLNFVQLIYVLYRNTFMQFLVDNLQ